MSAKPRMVVRGGENRNGKNHISCGHYHEAADNSAFVILCFVGNKTAYKAENVDAGVEE